MIVIRCLPILWTILLVLRLILGRSNGFILLAHRNIDINCCFQSGMYALQLMDNYSATYSLLFLGIMMTLVLSWVYGECHVTWVPSTGAVPMLPLAQLYNHRSDMHDMGTLCVQCRFHSHGHMSYDIYLGVRAS